MRLPINSKNVLRKRPPILEKDSKVGPSHIPLGAFCKVTGLLFH